MCQLILSLPDVLSHFLLHFPLLLLPLEFGDHQTISQLYRETDNKSGGEQIDAIVSDVSAVQHFEGSVFPHFLSVHLD